jgi:hypothetical protein
VGLKMTSDFLRLTPADRKFLRGLRIDPGPTAAERLEQFAESLEQKQRKQSTADPEAAQ